MADCTEGFFDRNPQLVRSYRSEVNAETSTKKEGPTAPGEPLNTSRSARGGECAEDGATSLRET